MYRHKKKDHGIVDNGHTMRWRYHDIPWFILNGCRWLYDCKIEVLVVHKLDVFILVIIRLTNHRQTHYSTQDLLCQHTI